MKKPYSIMLGMVLACALIASMGAINLQLVAPTLPALTADNTSVDNGPAILEYIKQGAIIPKGCYYVSTTIATTPSCTGLSLRGTGMSDFVRADGVWNDTGMNSTVLVWNGVADGTVVQINSGAFRVEDISIIGKSLPNITAYNNLSDADKTATIIQIYQLSGTQKPVGHIQFNRCMFGVGQYGILANGTTHCGHVSLYDIAFHWVKTPMKIDQNQSVEWFGRAITCYPGGASKGSAMLETDEGGRVDLQITALDNWESIVKGPLCESGDSAYNYGYYHIQLWPDNTAYIDNAIVERSSRSDDAGAWVCDIDGYSAENNDLGDPIATDGVINPGSRFTVDVKRIRHITPPITPDFTFPNTGGDVTAPTITARTVDSDGLLQLTASEPLTGIICNATGDGWTITASGGAVTGAGNNWRGGPVPVIYPSRAIQTGETVTLAYNRTAAGNKLMDFSGNLLQDFAAAAVTNNSTQPAPTVASAAMSGGGIVVTMSDVPSPNVTGTYTLGWTVTVNGTPRAVTGASGGGTSPITLTFGTAITAGQTVTLAYSSSTGNIKDTGDNDLATFTAIPVTNP